MGKIFIIGLGPGNYKDLTIEALEKIKSGNENFLRTENHPTVEYLKAENIKFKSFDNLYDKLDSFEDVYEKIVEILLSEAESKDINYIVPGNPMVAEKTTELLLNTNADIKIIHGLSFLEPLFRGVKLDPVDGFLLLGGDNLNKRDLDVNKATIIGQIYNERVLSDVKLKLADIYSDEYPVFYLEKLGMEDEIIKEIPIYKLDRDIKPGLLSSIYIKPPKDFNRSFFSFNDLLEIFEILRSNEGCPWDRKQSHKSIIKNLIEEANELAIALESGHYDDIIEELGDVLLQVIFHSQIADEEGNFDIYEVMNTLGEKLIYRHPHVFSQLNVENSQSIVYNWDVLKYQKRDVTTYVDRLREFKGLPSLLKSYKIQEEVAKIGFDWDDICGPIKKIEEEFTEVKEVIENKDSKERLTEEIGDLLFSVVNLARLLDISPNLAIEITSEKFIERFELMEKYAEDLKKDLKSMTLEELESLWEEAKKEIELKNEEEL